ncbi:MAG: hypothetical protein AAFV85_00570 [Cyanobacteria bacterium J06634_6]
MTPATSHAKFPLWQYLTQPIGEASRKPIINPRKFWHTQKLRHIERCWITSYVPEEHMS